MSTAVHAVTGALGYSGRAIAQRLIARGERVRTLTNSRRANPFGDALDIRPLAFDDEASLLDSLRAVRVLFNTYWVRFNHPRFDFPRAVQNSRALFAAAAAAGVERIVHVSILNPQQGRGLAYYDGKLEVEAALRECGVPHTVLRPGVLFGEGDILINNIAWMLRRLPVFGVPGDGLYKVQPMHVGDFAHLALAAADMPARPDDRTIAVIDAVGPETFTFIDLVRTLRSIIGSRARVVRLPAWAVLAVSRLLGRALGDVILTRDEIEGLMRGLLASDAPPTGPTRLTDWARAGHDTIGRRYESELARRSLA